MKLTQICKCTITKINDCICVHYVKCASYVLCGYFRGVLFFGLEHDENKNTLSTRNNNNKTKPLLSMTILFRKFLTLKTYLMWKCDIQKDCTWFTPWQSTQTRARHSLLSKCHTLSWYMHNHYLHLCPLANYGLPCTDFHETHNCPKALHSDLLNRILLKLDIKYTKYSQKFHLHF
jgi:hypothetical protein